MSEAIKTHTLTVVKPKTPVERRDMQRRQQDIKEEMFMDEIRGQLKDLSIQQRDLLVEQKVTSAAFVDHKIHNAEDFKHVDDCIHRSENQSRERDDSILLVVNEIRKQFDEVRTLVWKASGALLVIVPAVNWLIPKILSHV